MNKIIKIIICIVIILIISISLLIYFKNNKLIGSGIFEDWIKHKKETNNMGWYYKTYEILQPESIGAFVQWKLHIARPKNNDYEKVINIVDKVITNYRENNPNAKINWKINCQNLIDRNTIIELINKCNIHYNESDSNYEIYLKIIQFILTNAERYQNLILKNKSAEEKIELNNFYNILNAIESYKFITIYVDINYSLITKINRIDFESINNENINEISIILNNEFNKNNIQFEKIYSEYYVYSGIYTRLSNVIENESDIIDRYIPFISDYIYNSYKQTYNMSKTKSFSFGLSLMKETANRRNNRIDLTIGKSKITDDNGIKHPFTDLYYFDKNEQLITLPKCISLINRKLTTIININLNELNK